MTGGSGGIGSATAERLGAAGMAREGDWFVTTYASNGFQCLGYYASSCSRLAPITRSISVFESCSSCGRMNACSKVP